MVATVEGNQIDASGEWIRGIPMAGLYSIDVPRGAISASQEAVELLLSEEVGGGTVRGTIDEIIHYGDDDSGVPDEVIIGVH